MLTGIYQQAFVGALSGIWAFMFCRVLTAPGMVFSLWPVFCEEYLPAWLNKPLHGCPVCNSFWANLGLYLILTGGDLWGLIPSSIMAFFVAFALNESYIG